MSGQDFTTTITVDRSPEEVFDAVTDVRGWWSTAVQGNTRDVGDTFLFEVPGIHRCTMRVTEADPGRRVVWRVEDAWMSFVERSDEWTGTAIHFDIAPVTGGTQLRFTHVGLAPDVECFGVCSGAWGMYVTQSLHQRITTGRGTPHRPEAGITRFEADLLADHEAATD
jgi:uncharacterized protein YndB with AHSA1/START domain